MCDYCDCRRIPEIATLGKQHETIVDLGDELLRAVKAGSPDIGEAVERLRRALDPHVTREESGVFTQARIAGLGGYYVDELEDQHREFEEFLAGDFDAASLEQFLDDLHRHIAIEEYDLFPAASQVLSHQQWEVVDEITANQPAGEAVPVS